MFIKDWEGTVLSPDEGKELFNSEVNKTCITEDDGLMVVVMVLTRDRVTYIDYEDAREYIANDYLSERENRINFHAANGIR